MDLWILNYTHECQHAHVWDEITTVCRGLVVDKDWNVVARPFDKFFNLGEPTFDGDIPLSLTEIIARHGKYTIEEKVDGSLGILFKYGNEWVTATRGSFNSDQAKRMIEIMRNSFEKTDKPLDLSSLTYGYTHLFEIIYPENRIVIDYKGEEKLVYLGSRNNETGEYIKIDILMSSFDNPKIYDHLEQNIPNAEGYVLHFDDEFRLKVKFEEYKRLHKILTGLNVHAVWEMMKKSKDMKPLEENVPEEFMIWLKSVRRDLQGRFEDIRFRSAKAFGEISKEVSIGDVDIVDFRREDYLNTQRKLFSAFSQRVRTLDPKIQGIVTMMLKGSMKEFVTQEIWDLVEPTGNVKFKEDEGE